jgi:hypothetical protein
VPVPISSTSMPSRTSSASNMAMTRLGIVVELVTCGCIPGPFLTGTPVNSVASVRSL